MGDVVVGTDADVMIWNQDLVINAARKCIENKQILGTMAYSAPFYIEEWHKLFDKYKMKDNFDYECSYTKEKSPFYINLGVVMIPATFNDLPLLNNKRKMQLSTFVVKRMLMQIP